MIFVAVVVSGMPCGLQFDQEGYDSFVEAVTTGVRRLRAYTTAHGKYCLLRPIAVDFIGEPADSSDGALVNVE